MSDQKLSLLVIAAVGAGVVGMVLAGFFYYMLCWWISIGFWVVFISIDELLFIDAIGLFTILFFCYEGIKFFYKKNRVKIAWLLSMGLGTSAIIEGILFSIWALSMTYPFSYEYFLLVAIGTGIVGFYFCYKGLEYYRLHQAFKNL